MPNCLIAGQKLNALLADSMASLPAKPERYTASMITDGIMNLPVECAYTLFARSAAYSHKKNAGKIANLAGGKRNELAFHRRMVLGFNLRHISVYIYGRSCRYKLRYPVYCMREFRTRGEGV